MVKLSDNTIELLKEDILSILNENPMKSRFTKEISFELRRDKEFTLGLLLDMKEKGWVEDVKGKGSGSVRKKWRITNKLFNEWNKD
tara:strand:+ start:317 stop:574 length:258 start_codon:yes stop_codon:yes gene_type:complete